MVTASRRIWGWYFYDWASQPYNTLLITFIFAPYVTSQLADGSTAQATWAIGIGIAGLLIALFSPLLGTIADRSGRRIGFIWLFSLMYILGAWGIWYAAPGDLNLWFVMGAFILGMVGMEFASTFVNAMLPDLAGRDRIGRISGSGWAFGYLGGLVSLVLILLFFAENPQGRTLIGLAPAFGLDAAAREGTRAVGPLTAIWYAVFMIPFFLWVREVRRPDAIGVGAAAREAWPSLKQQLRSLPRRRSLSAYLLSSMLYRDALNGIYAFGGVYAEGVLGWTVVEIGIFGILVIVTGAVFAWLGGRADSRFGPKPVIVTCVLVLALTTAGIVFVSRESVLGVSVGPDSRLPDIGFYVLGALIGAAGGALQSASRTMMVHQADPARMTEAFGLYALAGKATSFLAPALIYVATTATGSQAAGISPLIVLFLLSLVLLVWVRTGRELEPA